MSTMEEIVLDIATDFLEKQGHKVEIRLFDEIINARAGVGKFGDRYNFYINKNALSYSITGETEDFEVAKDLIDTILHECIHIICMEKNLNSNECDLWLFR